MCHRTTITNIIKSFDIIMTSKYADDHYLVFLGIILTGLDIYDSLGKYAVRYGCTITGFANSIVSPALNIKRVMFLVLVQRCLL